MLTAAVSKQPVKQSTLRLKLEACAQVKWQESLHQASLMLLQYSSQVVKHGRKY